MARQATKTVPAGSAGDSTPPRAKAAAREFKPLEVAGVPIFVGTSGWAYSIWKPE